MAVLEQAEPQAYWTAGGNGGDMGASSGGKNDGIGTGSESVDDCHCDTSEYRAFFRR